MAEQKTQSKAHRKGKGGNAHADEQGDGKKKGQAAPKYQKPPKVPGPRPNSYAPNRERQQARAEQERREEESRRASERLQQLTLRASQASVRYANFILGVSGDYSVYEDLGDDYKLREFYVYVAPQLGGIMIRGHQDQGAVRIPHDFLFTEEDKCRFGKGEIGLIQKAMRAFLVRVMRDEIEAARPGWEEERAAAKAVETPEAPKLHLASSNGQAVKPAVVVASTLSQVSELASGRNGFFDFKDAAGASCVVEQKMHGDYLSLVIVSCDAEHHLSKQGILPGLRIRAENLNPDFPIAETMKDIRGGELFRQMDAAREFFMEVLNKEGQRLAA
jgi:hypothetical protein